MLEVECVINCILSRTNPCAGVVLLLNAFCTVVGCVWINTHLCIAMHNFKRIKTRHLPWQSKQIKIGFEHFSHEQSINHLGRIKQIWYLSPMRAAKVQASLHIRAVSPEPPLLAHTSSESRGTFRQKARSLASLNGWACAVKICHDGILEDTNLLDGAHLGLSCTNSCLFFFFIFYNCFAVGSEKNRSTLFSFVEILRIPTLL